jgi:hypothetical protein
MGTSQPLSHDTVPINGVYAVPHHYRNFSAKLILNRSKLGLFEILVENKKRIKERKQVFKGKLMKFPIIYSIEELSMKKAYPGRGDHHSRGQISFYIYKHFAQPKRF